MNILIFGAAGDVGSRTVTEALMRGHKVSAVIRRPGQIEKLPANVLPVISEVSESSDLISIMEGQDLVISTLRPAEGHENALPTLTAKVLQSAQRLNKPIIVVGGAARLKIPGKDTTVLTEPGFLPPSAVNIAKACFKQSQLFKPTTSGEWSHICPPALLYPGVRTGNYRTGRDALIIDETGNSQISMEDFAVALMDEAEKGVHRRQIFTVAY